MDFETLQVECYSGFKDAERPVAFLYQGRRWEILEILDRWYEGSRDPARPEVRYFKVKTAGDRTFLLRYLSLFDSWSILRGSLPGPRDDR
jgi:hypothetical protein